MYGLGKLGDKVTAFTVRVVRATEYLKERKALSLADQFFRSGTSIGANCSEAVYAVSKADFLNKLHIALKETNETAHWIEVMYQGQYIDYNSYESILGDCIEIRKLLSTITRNVRTTIQNDTKKD